MENLTMVVMSSIYMLVILTEFNMNIVQSNKISSTQTLVLVDQIRMDLIAIQELSKCGGAVEHIQASKFDPNGYY